MGGRTTALVIDGRSFNLNLKPDSISVLEGLSPKKLGETLDKAAFWAAQEREAKRLDKIAKQPSRPWREVRADLEKLL